MPRVRPSRRAPRGSFRKSHSDRTAPENRSWQLGMGSGKRKGAAGSSGAVPANEREQLAAPGRFRQTKGSSWQLRGGSGKRKRAAGSSESFTANESEQLAAPESSPGMKREQLAARDGLRETKGSSWQLRKVHRKRKGSSWQLGIVHDEQPKAAGSSGMVLGNERELLAASERSAGTKGSSWLVQKVTGWEMIRCEAALADRAAEFMAEFRPVRNAGTNEPHQSPGRTRSARIEAVGDTGDLEEVYDTERQLLLRRVHGGAGSSARHRRGADVGVSR